MHSVVGSFCIETSDTSPVANAFTVNSWENGCHMMYQVMTCESRLSWTLEAEEVVSPFNVNVPVAKVVGNVVHIKFKV